MRIGIVLHPYNEEKPGGLARVIFEWTKALIERDTENEYIVYVKNTPGENPKFNGGSWKLVPLGGGFRWLDMIKHKKRCDVYIFNTPVLPMTYSPKNSIIIAYDFPYKHLSAKSIREYVQYKITGWYHWYSFKRADAVISVSDSTKSEVAKLFGVAEEKITTIYHGFKKICSLEEKSIEIPNKFFFFAGTIKERKNVFAIVEAFNLFKSANPDTEHKLVIAGKKEGSYYEKLVTYISEHGISDDVVFLDHINDNMLSYVYKHAEALVFPSLIEGTGNPILEAMDCGIPVITSNIFGPAELGSHGSAVLIDPYKPQEIADGMEKIVCDESFRDTLVQRGRVQAKKFTWDIAYTQTKNLIEKVVKKRHE